MDDAYYGDYFEDCFQSDAEKKAEPSLCFEDVYFDAPSINLGDNSEPVYDGNRKRLVRFLEDKEAIDGGSMMMGGLAATGGMAAAGLLASKANDAFQESDASMGMRDIFDKGGSGDLDAHTDAVRDDDNSNNSFDEEKEAEEQIRRTFFITIFGIGFRGVLMLGVKKLMNILGHDQEDQDLGAGDIVGDGIDTATQPAQGASGGSSSQATAQASFNASANASSQSSSNAFAMFTVGNNPAAMTGAQ
jgi:hypothetical protein